MDAEGVVVSNATLPVLVVVALFIATTTTTTIPNIDVAMYRDIVA
jgi:hypothetical protein